MTTSRKRPSYCFSVLFSRSLPSRTVRGSDWPGLLLIGRGVWRNPSYQRADGQPIIILGETVTGGYRKIGTVISADLPLLGQMKPEERVRFQEVTMDEAFQALRKAEGAIRSFNEIVLQ